MSESAAGICFRLAVPLVSWSEAGAVIRPTDLIPSWSAITGMIGAALGWGRDDARLDRLAADYAMAVQVEQFGERLQDFHTIQSPEAAQAQRIRVRTRADELEVPTIHTTITRREYVSGARYVILVLPCRSDPGVSAQAIADALRRPAFALYAGRRSCAVGFIAAEVVTGNVDHLLPAATHWDSRLVSARTPSLIRERRDQRVGPRQYAVRHECVA